MQHDSSRKTAGAPLIRPRLIIETAQIGARSYQRLRDLPGALAAAGGAARPVSDTAILARLTEAELAC